MLDNELDTHKTRIEELPVAQLRDECRTRSLDSTGKKVFISRNAEFITRTKYLQFNQALFDTHFYSIVQPHTLCS